MHSKKWEVMAVFGRLWRERRPMLVSVLILLVGLPAVLIAAQLSKDSAGNSKVVDKAIQQYQSVTGKGEYSSAYEELKTQESLATTKEQKVALYASLAAAAANVNKLPEAIGYLEQKHQADPSTKLEDSYMMAILYQRTGDTTKAIEQFKLSIEYYKTLPSDLSNDARIKSTQETINQLEAAQ